MTPRSTESFWERNKERILTSAFAFLLIYSLFRNVLRAASRPLWFDELLTLIVARQPTVTSIWRALAHCADGNPPPYYLLQRFFDHLSSDEQIAFRALSILGFCLMEWCLFVWLRKRHSASVAFAACMLPFLTDLFATYSVEARPYAVEIGFLAIALLAYQRASTPFWIFLLGLSLVAAQSSHYYAIFLVGLFFVAETFYFLRTKTFRIGVWIALCCGLLPLFIFWPMLSHFKTCYGTHVWYVPATLFGTFKYYSALFGIGPVEQGAASWMSWLVLMLPAAILLGIGFLFYRSLNRKGQSEPTLHLDLLTCGILLLPFIMLAATKLTHTGLIPRYLLPTILGVVLGAGYGLSLLGKRIVASVGVLLFLCFAIQETGFWISYHEARLLKLNAQPSSAPLIESAGHPELPVVVSEGHDYLELSHYASRSLLQRLKFVADPDAAVSHHRPDTNDRNLLILRDFAHLNVIEYARFKESRREFLLYSAPTPENNPDWFITRLEEDGWLLERLVTDGRNSVYLVTTRAEEH